MSEQPTYEDIGGDQLDCAELMMAFETEFQLHIPDKDQERLCTSDDRRHDLLYLGECAAVTTASFWGTCIHARTTLKSGLVVSEKSIVLSCAVLTWSMQSGR